MPTSKRRVHLVSYTPIDAPGGVPRFNRDLRAALSGSYDVRHASWFGMLDEMKSSDAAIPEWEKAKVTNHWLRRVGANPDDIYVVDGFWGAGLEDFPNVVSVAHGNWSHTTADDVANGVPPEFPALHAAQLRYRQKHLDRGGRIVSVSRFISDQCQLQWGMTIPYINNGVNNEEYQPAAVRLPRRRPIVIHGTTTANKGLDHISLLRDSLDADVWLLDEAAEKMRVPKKEALAQADFVVHPSAHEGNSYFVLETLSSGVPIVSYDVGLMWQVAREFEPGGARWPGIILSRKDRSSSETVNAARAMLQAPYVWSAMAAGARKLGELFSVEEFGRSWRAYLTKEFGT